MERLYSKLKKYSESDFYPFHMPGHKRNTTLIESKLPFDIDITEIDGFDNLHHANDILKNLQERAASLYHAEETHYLVNGSTSGILSAILGCTSKGGTIVMARNCHKSVYHAVYMNELHPIYLYPKFYSDMELCGEIMLEDVEKALEDYPNIQAVVITSPTYEGILSDVESIAKIVHRKSIPLIVDEAHGAHFGMHSYFPENSNKKGADVVIHSLHKTLPSLTQTALIHMNGKYVNRCKVRKYLQIFQTSSPSYVFMASIDECIRVLEGKKQKLFDYYTYYLDEMRKKLYKLKYFVLLESEEFDRSKIIISVKNISNMTGKDLYRILLENYHLQMEMAAGDYIVAMTSIGDTNEGFNRFVDALFEIEDKIKYFDSQKKYRIHFQIPKQEQCYSSYEIEELRKEISTDFVFWNDAKGKISLEYAYLYPPGVPIIVPGERISEEAANLIQEYERMGFEIQGINVENKVEVWINE